MPSAAAVRGRFRSGLVGLERFSVTWLKTPCGGLEQTGDGGGAQDLEAYGVTKLTSEALR